MKREFLQLAHNFEEDKYGIGSWWMSEKLDGMRCFWDGGITRGIPTNEVPFANTAKDDRYRNQQLSTGLWSRYGKPIQAPGYWLDTLPKSVFLDGELWMGRTNFQSLVSTVKQLIPDARWKDVKFMVFDSPKPEHVFGVGTINNTNFKKTFDSAVLRFFEGKVLRFGSYDFDSVITELKSIINKTDGDTVWLLDQEKLPWRTSEAIEVMQEKLFEVSSVGGEGLMLRKPGSIWLPERNRNLLKVKKLLDDEGIVVGYKWGKATDKGSKLLGLMGSVIVRFNGKEFELSGFTEAEREIVYGDKGESAREYGERNPGELVPTHLINPLFPRGSKIRFKYRELTNSGIPKEARYFR